MRKAFKYRLWTNRNQERELGIMLETHRRLYNECLAQRKEAYESEKKSIKYTEQSAWYKEQRKVNKYYARLNFSSAQATMRRLNKAFQNFFRRLKTNEKPGYPRFKARDRYASIEFPAHGDGIRLTNDRLRIQHVGVIRVKLHRPVEGKVKTLTLKKEADKWFIIASCELEDVVHPQSQKPGVGVDVGIEFFLTTSDGEHIPNPNFLKKELPALRRAQRSVGRKKNKKSNNRRKAVKKVQKLHTKVRNKRRDFHFKTANNLVSRYGYIAAESLNTKDMIRTRRFARAIADVGWNQWANILKFKAASAGVEVVFVDPKNTSQQCSCCGEIVRKSLSVRKHCCPHCGLELHRDINAARNIFNKSYEGRTGPLGRNAAGGQRAPRSRLL